MPLSQWPAELAEYDAIIFGTPTRFGNMSGQMRNFLDQTGGLWAKGALVGEGRKCIYLDRHRWRSRDDHHLYLDHPGASWDGDCPNRL